MRVHRVAIVSALCVVLASAASAGDVTVTVTGGKLKIAGGAGDESIFVNQFGVANAKQFRVAPGGGTTVNGAMTDAVFSGVTGDITILLGDGNDHVTFDALATPKRVMITEGAAGALVTTADTVTIGGDLRVTVPGGVAKLNLAHTTIRGDCRMTSGDLSDEVHLESDVLIDGDLKLDLGNGTNVAQSFGLQVHGRGDMRMGTGPDTLNLAVCSFDRDFKFTSNGGADGLALQIMQVATNVTVKCGNGTDSLHTTLLDIGGNLKVDLGGGTNGYVCMGSTIGRTLSMRGGSGVDSAVIEDATEIGGDCRLDFGDGLNGLILDQSSIGRDLRVTGGTGEDDIAETLLDVRGNVRARLGGTGDLDGNSILWNNGRVGKGFSIDGGELDDTFNTSGSVVKGATRLRLGGGANVASFTSTSMGSVDVRTGDQVDTVNLKSQSSVNGKFKLSAGNGMNDVDLIDSVIGDDLIVRVGVDVDSLTLTNLVVGGKRDVKDAGP